MDMQTIMRALGERRDLGPAEMRGAMEIVMGGGATPAQIGAFLMGLKIKGETIDEIAAAAQVMRALATPVSVADDGHLVDTCGTGGDGACTFNISTASAFVVAAAGGRVAKHGNRSVSSRSGSADVLEAAGANLELTPEQVGRCIMEVGFGFLFAPRHHSAMKHAIGPRRELGVRTIFNVLGPLTNPAGARRQVLGAFSASLLQPLAEVLGRLGSVHVLVVHAEDGLDEISLNAPTQVAELKDGRVSTYVITPEQFGIERAPLDALRVETAEQSVAVVRQALSGEAGPARDIVALNAGAAVYAAGLASSLQAGVAGAKAALASGAGARKLDEFVAFTQQFK